ncbi:MAG: AraC family transcriptional regulator [Oscillospiraceae bacterium]|jgi:AraC-like DNA-binding protein|nr:AraC family transcriptional regulator [Oscillospiraceae bacterium]
MDSALLQTFRPLTDMEWGILDLLEKEGLDSVASKDYHDSVWDTVMDHMKSGWAISLHRHPRFFRAFEHEHSWNPGRPVEMVYVCAGQRSTIVSGKSIDQQAGELLIVDQYAKHEDFPLGENDISLGFLVRPELFLAPLGMMGSDNSEFRSFLAGSLRQDQQAGRYMHFQVAEVPQVQNLMENLIRGLLTGEYRSGVNQYTMGALAFTLLEHQDKAIAGGLSQGDLTCKILRYIEAHCANGSLEELAGSLHYNMNWLSTEIKRLTGSSFKELQQGKRLAKAKILLSTTDFTIDTIAKLVGLTNLTRFYQQFREQNGCSPKEFRKATR